MKKRTTDELGRLSVEEFREAEKIPVAVVADDIRSLNNIGSIFRTCDAFAVRKLCLCGITATPPNKEIHKTAIGAEFSVEWQYYPNCTEAVSELKNEGYTVVAVEQVEGSVLLDRFEPDPSEKYAVILGNEVFGVSQEAVDLSDMALEIPQYGTKHSLNVSVAAGVVLWHLCRRLHP